MLDDLQNLQSSEENVWHVNLTFDVETRSKEDDEIVHKEFTFSYSEYSDEWAFHEYVEKRTPDTTRTSNRNWRKARHILWSDSEVPTIDIPPEVSKSLAEATGADSVTIRAPEGSINDIKYKKFKYENN